MSFHHGQKRARFIALHIAVRHSIKPVFYVHLKQFVAGLT